MKKTVPWNVKGVGIEAREAAHLAARRAGLTLGDWLNSVICDRADELGVTTDDFSSDERLDALVARLAGVAESVQPGEDSEWVRAAATNTRAALHRPAGARPMSHSLVDDELPEIRDQHVRAGRRAAGSRRATGSGADTWDSDILLDQAIELVGRRSSAAEERRSGEQQRLKIAALAKEVERLNQTDFEDDEREVRRREPTGRSETASRSDAPRPLRDAVGSVAERIGEIEHRIASRDADRANRPIVAALSRLEDRFEHLMRRNADGVRESSRVEATFRDFDSRLRDLATRLDRDPPVAVRASAQADRDVATPASVLSRLDAAMPGRDDGRDGNTVPAGVAARRTGRDTVAEITKRQADLEAAEQRRATLLSGTSHASMEQQQRETALRGVRRPTAEISTPKPEPRLSGIDEPSGLNEAFARLTERLEARLDEAARARVEAPQQAEDIGILKSGIAALGDRLDAMRHGDDQSRVGGSDRHDVEMLRNEIAALQVGIAKLAPQSAFTTLENAVRELGGQIDESRRDGVSEAVLAPLERLRSEVRQAVDGRDVGVSLQRIEQQLEAIAANLDHAGDPALLNSDGSDSDAAELRELLRTAATQFASVERLEGEIARLAGKVERLGDLPARSAIRDLELAVNEIRTMLVEFSPEAALQDVSRKLDGFAERFSVIEDQIATPAVLFDEFSRRMDEAHAQLADRLSKATPTVDLAPIQDMIGGLSGKIDSLKFASGDMQALGGLVRGLAAQIEEARLPSADAKVLDTLETQVGRLAERLDRSDESLDAISSVERLVRDLFQQIDETRVAAIDAAETAARNAAQETLRAALSSPAIAGDDTASRANHVFDQVGHELAEFRKVQQTSEKRVHSTLLALNETLEKMVDRMVIDARAVPTPAPAVAALPVAVSPIAVIPGKIDALNAVEPAVITEPALGGSSGSDLHEADAQKSVEIKRPMAATKVVAPTIEIERPPLAEPMPDVSPLIAAARRAALAAQASATEAGHKVDTKVSVAKPTGAANSNRTWRNGLWHRRRPILLSVASVVLLLGALQMARLTQNNHESAGADLKEQVAQASTESDTAAKPAALTTQSPAPLATLASNAPVGRAAAPIGSTAPANPDVEKNPPAPKAIATSEPAPKSLTIGLRDSADRGDPAAEAEVGARLAEGRGIARDTKTAADWFDRSAKQGFAPAEYRLGSAYEKGTGVTADPAQAVSWYEKAANQGNIRAMHNLAVMAAEGSASKPDYARAASWFTKAAEHGVRDSQYNLAILYARGLGLSQDLSQSYTWFALAAAQGDADAAKKRDDVAGKLDSDKMAEAKAAMAAFKPLPVDRHANEISAPPSGWDVASPAAGTGVNPKLSTM